MALAVALPARAEESAPDPALSGGLRLVTGFDSGTATEPGAVRAPCLGLGAGESPLIGCLSRGGGLDRATDSAPRHAPRPALGLSFGHEGWLSLGAGLAIEADPRPAGSGLGVSSATLRSGTGTYLGTERIVGSLSAFVDLNAATGLRIKGLRPYLGADVSVGHVNTPASLRRDEAGRAVAVSPMSGTGMTWGATAGSDVTLGGGLSLGFAYRYTGQQANGPLDHGAALGLGAAGGGASGDEASTGDHGMAIGLRLQF
ncbi:hypothetical protein [Roseospira navarrensis]|uniref:Outer membrane protein beta-barrel domain-containing protein n=1 Tax=Roseospira navarrensis TaxID=140058 RepID=A0A7X1ZGS9_9PROT|nr:hypothetical protein [Roseospira navarrensis]MQX37336.1 hypothetical protein [Roseospira navarrensis]